MKIAKLKGSKIHHIVTEDIPINGHTFKSVMFESSCGQLFIREHGATVAEMPEETMLELVQAGKFCKRCAKRLEAALNPPPPDIKEEFGDGDTAVGMAGIVGEFCPVSAFGETDIIQGAKTGGGPMKEYTLEEILEILRRMGKAKNMEEYEFQMELKRQAVELRRKELKEMFPMKMVRNFDGESGEVDFPLFGTEIEISIDSDYQGSNAIPLEYIDKCAEHLINLPENVINILCESSIRYCEDMRENIDFGSMGFPVPENIVGRKILQYIHPKSLIMEPQEYNSVVLHLELDCDWEPEHGMEWIIRDNEVLYVSSFNWEHPWEEKEYFKNMEGNYAIID